jgi:hypothetical protein
MGRPLQRQDRLNKAIIRLVDVYKTIPAYLSSETRDDAQVGCCECVREARVKVENASSLSLQDDWHADNGRWLRPL